MDFIVDLIKDFSGFLENNIDFVALSLSVVILILFGSKLTAFFKQKLGRLHGIFRCLIFSGLCLLFGLILQLLTKMLAALFEQLNDVTLAPVVVLLFITFGILIEKRN